MRSNDGLKQPKRALAVMVSLADVAPGWDAGRRRERPQVLYPWLTAAEARPLSSHDEPQACLVQPGEGCASWVLTISEVEPGGPI